jgi:hypothetical protein
MDGQTGERAHRQGWTVVLAGYAGGLIRFCRQWRPGVIAALGLCLALLQSVRRLDSSSFVMSSIGAISFTLALPALHRSAWLLCLVCGLIAISFTWWLPRGQQASLIALLPLVVLPVPLLLSDPIMSACGLALVAAALSPLLAQGERDGGAMLLVAQATLGAALLATGVAAAQPALDPEVPSDLTLARLAILGGLALVLGIVPFPFWLPGVSERGHAAGAMLAAALIPVLAYVWAGDLLAAHSGWLAPEATGAAAAAAGASTAAIAGGAAVFQTNPRRLFGCLLAAGLGYSMLTLGVALQNGPAAVAMPSVVPQLAGQVLAALAGLGCLGLLAGGLRRSLRPALFFLLACCGWLALGGPLSAAFADRWAAIRSILAGGQPGAALCLVALVASSAAYAVFLWRIGRASLPESDRPAQPLVLGLATALVITAMVW